MKTRLALALLLSLALTACGAKDAGTVELRVFAAASMTETLDEIIQAYREEAPGVAIVPTYDSSGVLLAQIQEGAECDLFLSAAPKQMDALEEGGSLLEGTRLDLLENQVALAVPEGNPRGIESFDQLVGLLESGDVLLSMGGGDVPVGQYTRKIFAYYGLDEAALSASGVLTYGSNVKEVAAQVSEGAVDCGVIYSTDAASAGLAVVDTASARMCGKVVYPAAVLANSRRPDEARAFLDYLQTENCAAIFERAGFKPIR